MDGMDLKDLKWSVEIIFMWLTLLNENSLVGLGISLVSHALIPLLSYCGSKKILQIMSLLD
ncbi:hypothetical protein Gogos_012002, partial [Gossypium gossypioides]|nr:hypothetical protein [Gossypium gossypioides]